MTRNSSNLMPETTADEKLGGWQNALRKATSGSGFISILSVLIALVLGSVLIILTSPKVQEASQTFAVDPFGTIYSAMGAVFGAYSALLKGSIYNTDAASFAAGIRPLTETLTFATPLIMAGLGVGLAFRAGLFNIGGRGQMLLAAGTAGWVAVNIELPWGVHMLAATLAGVIGGALWGGLAGLLKAKTGAHEVITTIMLNYIGFYALSLLLRTPVLKAPGQQNAKSAPIASSAEFPALFGDNYNLHFGFIIAILVTIFATWFLNQSSIGFQFKAVGLNPHSARVAGIDVGRTYVFAMVLSGSLMGLAGASQVLGTNTSGFTSGVDSGIGFDAITVALLGRSKPWGVFGAGIILGAFRAGGFTMQAAEGISADIVVVLQAVIVLLIAAPPLVREIFRIPNVNSKKIG